jgi:anti-sigma factor RsiW
MLMNCSEVVARFSEYLDGTVAEAECAAIDRHLRDCDACVRYRDVLIHGAALLRQLPAPELGEDFAPRLRHRLYHVDDERVLRAHAASGASAVTVLGIAVLLTAVAWSPTLLQNIPVVELAPIVVDRAPARSPFVPVGSPPGTFSSKSDAELDEALFENALLYDYSPLSQRYDQRARVRRASLFDR